MSMQTLVGARPSMSDRELTFIREMAVSHVELNISEAEANVETLQQIAARFAAFGITIDLINCVTLQKNDIIDLNLTEKNGKPADRDAEIFRFNELVKAAAGAGIHIVSVAWQPTGVKRTGFDVRPHTRGGIASYVDLEEIQARPNDYDRTFTEEEVWANFEYFLKAVTPTCHEYGVRIALHPNDPPVPSMCGIASLIWNMDCYRRAIALDPAGILGIKLCVGCWLEGGDAFGDILSDIQELVSQDRIILVHFRNVSSTLPYFEETLAEDGYADMYAIMKQLIVSGYEGLIYVDHVFDEPLYKHDPLVPFAYPTGYMKGLMHAIEREVKGR